MQVNQNAQAVDTTRMSMSARSSGLGCGLLGCGWLSINLFDGVNEI